MKKLFVAVVVAMFVATGVLIVNAARSPQPGMVAGPAPAPAGVAAPYGLDLTDPDTKVSPDSTDPAATGTSTGAASPDDPATGAPGKAGTSTGTPNGPGTTYLFNDNFDGPKGAGPSTRWVQETGKSGNSSDTYTNSRANSQLDGKGHLVLKVTKDGSGYKTARLSTRDTFAANGGYWEIRLKLTPTTYIWPAFWMLGSDFGTREWPECGEIDVMENYGRSAAQFSYHQGVPQGFNYSKNDAQTRNWVEHATIDSGWHTWGVRWDATKGTLAFYKDGVLHHTYQAPKSDPVLWGTDSKMLMILTEAVGGAAGKDHPANIKLPPDMLIDYVRVSR